MGKSKTGGAFGFIKKSIGSVTYSTMKDKNGKRVQILRAKPTDVTNPNTIAQIIQRMKVKPAARFYKAFEEVLNNAFEGIAYGAGSRKEFMHLAMSQTGPYIPKNATRFIPAKYPVSRGSVASPSEMQWVQNGDMSSAAFSKTGFTFFIDSVGSWEVESSDPATIAAQAYGKDVQLTFLTVVQTADGSFTVGYARVLTAEYTAENMQANPALAYVNTGNATALFYKGVGANKIDFFGGTFTDGQTAGIADAHDKVVAAAVIVSYKDGEAWLRSNTDMSISPALELNLYGADAQELAVESYQDASAVNNLNSTWYLNLANGQQYPGNLSLITETFQFSVQEGGETTIVRQDLTYPYGSLINDRGQIRRQIFADASGNMIFNVNGTYTTVQNPEEAEGVKIKWSDIALQSQLYGNNDVLTWKEAYQLQIGA